MALQALGMSPTGCDLRNGTEAEPAREVRQAAGAQDRKSHAEGRRGALDAAPHVTPLRLRPKKVFPTNGLGAADYVALSRAAQLRDISVSGHRQQALLSGRGCQSSPVSAWVLLTAHCGLQMRSKRQERLFNERMARAKGVRVAAEKRELEQDITLIRAPQQLARDVEAYQKEQKQQEKLRIPVEQSQQLQPELMDH